MRYKTLFLSLAMFAFLALNAMSQSVIESFDYPMGTSLDTLVGTAGNGWGGGWDHFDLEDSAYVVTDSGIVYDDLNYDTVPHRGLQAYGKNIAAWSGQRYGRDLDHKWPNEAGKVYWMSFLIQYSDDFSTNAWGLVSFWNTDGGEGPGCGHEWGNDSIGVSTYNRLGHSDYTVFDGPQWLVAKVEMTGDTLGQRVHMWVTPDPEGDEPDTSFSDAKGSWNLRNGFDKISIHFGGETVGMSMAVDEIRVGTSWADVSSPITALNDFGVKIPGKLELAQNYPNPFNPTTNISYNLERKNKVRLTVYDLLGREIAVLVNGTQEAGLHSVQFNAENLPSGIYFYKLQSAQGNITKKMSLLK